MCVLQMTRGGIVDRFFDFELLSRKGICKDTGIFDLKKVVDNELGFFFMLALRASRRIALATSIEGRKH